jgi:hypothetical protein
MTDKVDDGLKADPTQTLPSENEPGAVEVQRETTELVVHRRIREVVRYEHAPRSISLDKLTDPALAQALLDERDYWRDVAAERDESNSAIQARMTGFVEKYHRLDKRCALAEESLANANRANWLEGVFFAIGGALFSAGLSSPTSWPLVLVGLLLLAVAVASGLHRARRSNAEVR